MIGGVKTGALGAVLALALPVQAAAQTAGCWDENAVRSARINEFQTSMMVYHLRCKTAQMGFEEAYFGYLTQHQAALRAADGSLRVLLGGHDRESRRRFDSYATVLANSHGHGQANRGNCALFAEVAAELAQPDSSEDHLDAMARALVHAPYVPGERCPAQLARKE